MNVLVTGGLGFVGSAVVQELRQANHRVTILTRRAVSGHSSSEITLVQGDVTVADGVNHLINKEGFDGICHLAGLTGIRDSFARPANFFDVNVGGTVNLLKAVRTRYDRTGIATPIVFASSRAVYADTFDMPVSEAHPATPTTPYGLTKRVVEQLLGFESSLKVTGAVALRCFNISGGAPGIVDTDTQRLIPRLVGALAGNLPPPPLASGRSQLDLVHVIDVGRAFAKALDHAAPGDFHIYNVGSGATTSLEEVISLLEHSAGRMIPRGTGVSVKYSNYGAVAADISMIRDDLGWAPTLDVQTIMHDAWTYAEAGSSQRESLL